MILMKRYAVYSSWIDFHDIDNQHVEEFETLMPAVWYWLMAHLGLKEEANPWSSCILKNLVELRIKLVKL